MLIHVFSRAVLLSPVLPMSLQDPVGFNDWNDTEAMVMQHLTAVESQLVDMWYGLALAALLRRTIILPKVRGGRMVWMVVGCRGLQRRWARLGAGARRRRALSCHRAPVTQ